MSQLQELRNEPVMESKVNTIESRTGYACPKSLEVWSIQYTLWSRNGSGEKTAVVIGQSFEEVENYIHNFHRGMKIQINQKEFKTYIHGITPQVWKKFQDWLNKTQQLKQPEQNQMMKVVK